MLTLQRLQQHLADMLNRQLSSSNSIELLVNEAGIAWCNFHAWGYLSRRRRLIPFVPDQTVYGLGPDLKRVRSIVDPEYPVWMPELMQRPEFDEWRERLSSVGDYWWSGTVYDDVVDGVPQKVLEVYPAPSRERDVSLIYTAGWLAVDASNEPIDLPQQLEPAFVEFVRAFAAAREKRTTMAAAMEELKQNDVIMAAMRSESTELPWLAPTLGQVGHRFLGRRRGREVTFGPYGPRLRYPFGSH